MGRTKRISVSKIVFSLRPRYDFGRSRIAVFSGYRSTRKARIKPITSRGINDIRAQDSAEVTIIANVIFREFQIQRCQQRARSITLLAYLLRTPEACHNYARRGTGGETRMMAIPRRHRTG